MKVINDTPKGTPKENKDVISYMEDKYPGMTSEFQKYNENNTNSFYINNMTMAHRI
jgi:hypothetical protein